MICILLTLLVYPMFFSWEKTLFADGIQVSIVDEIPACLLLVQILVPTLNLDEIRINWRLVSKHANVLFWSKRWRSLYCRCGRGCIVASLTRWGSPLQSTHISRRKKHGHIVSPLLFHKHPVRKLEKKGPKTILGLSCGSLSDFFEIEGKTQQKHQHFPSKVNPAKGFHYVAALPKQHVPSATPVLQAPCSFNSFAKDNFVPSLWSCGAVVPWRWCLILARHDAWNPGENPWKSPYATWNIRQHLGHALSKCR